jgi:hypothetical protein
VGKPEDNKEVDFHFYCPLCENCDKSEGDLPCCDCLDCPVRVGTEKPIKFVGKPGSEGKIEEKYGRKRNGRSS